MILDSDKRVARVLVRLGLWKYYRTDLWKMPSIRASRGTRWLLERMRKRQFRDGLHHAPACPGNEWSGANLVIARCNCGAGEAPNRPDPLVALVRRPRP